MGKSQSAFQIYRETTERLFEVIRLQREIIASQQKTIREITKELNKLSRRLPV